MVINGEKIILLKLALWREVENDKITEKVYDIWILFLFTSREKRPGESLGSRTKSG